MRRLPRRPGEIDYGLEKSPEALAADFKKDGRM
jgi:hypothetical protein